MLSLIIGEAGELLESLVVAAREEGFQPVTVSAAAAVEAFREQRPVLIVLCWPAVDGIALCRQLRQLDPQHRCVLLVVANRNSIADLDAAVAAGTDDFLLSPDNPLLQRIRLRVAACRVRDRANAASVDHQLRESIERFDLAVKGANDGLWDALPRGAPWHHPDTEIWYSARFKDLIGFRDDEFPNKLGAWEARLHPEDHDRIIQAVAQHVENRVPYDVEYRLRTKSGEYRWFSARGQAQWDNQGRLFRMSGSLRDIHQTKEFESRLQQSEARWRSLVENAPNVILLCRPDGTMDFINQPGAGTESALGRTVYEYIEPVYHPIVRQAFDAVCATGAPQQYEMQGASGDGSIVWWSCSLGPVWQDGRVESVVMIAVDVSERKNAEHQLERHRQLLLRLMDLQERERRLVSYEIHDGMIQSLAAGIMHLEAHAAGLPKNATNSDEFERALMLLRETVAEGRRLISGLRPPILDEQGVVAALDYLVTEARQYVPGIELVTHAFFGRLAAPLEVTIFRITQEALANIRQHSGAKRARVELMQHGEWVRLVIRDWGCGFDPANVHEERFGLQGIRERARLLGTHATIESVPGQGTIIAVDFPLVRAEDAETSAAE